MLPYGFTGVNFPCFSYIGGPPGISLQPGIYMLQSDQKWQYVSKNTLGGGKITFTTPSQQPLSGLDTPKADFTTIRCLTFLLLSISLTFPISAWLQLAKGPHAVWAPKFDVLKQIIRVQNMRIHTAHYINTHRTTHEQHCLHTWHNP